MLNKQGKKMLIAAIVMFLLYVLIVVTQRSTMVGPFSLQTVYVALMPLFVVICSIIYYYSMRGQND